MQLVERTVGSGKQAWCRIAAWVVSLAAVIRVALVILSNWRGMQGWEAYWIAQAVATGKGYSFPFDVPWPLDPIGNGGFHPSAWVDPLYTLTLAGLIRFFGSYHQLAAAILNLILLLAVFGLTYRLGERLISPVAGLAAMLILVLNRAFSWNALYMNNTLLAATFVLLSALMLVRFLEIPGPGRAAALGLVLGLTLLACPGAQLFIPVAAVAVVVWGWKRRGPATVQAMLVLLVAALTVSPWAIRNYVALGQVVPGRTGLGHLTFLGSVALAGTVAPEKLPAHLTPPWQAATARRTVKEVVRSQENREALDRFLTDYTNAVGPARYSNFNEAQRDGWLLKQTKTFLLANPVISAKLALAKLEVFVRTMGIFGVLVFLLATAGGILAYRTPAVLTLAAWAGTFIGPFLIVICYWDRYRAPIEPILVILAVFAVCSLVAGIAPSWPRVGPWTLSGKATALKKGYGP